MIRRLHILLLCLFLGLAWPGALGAKQTNAHKAKTAKHLTASPAQSAKPQKKLNKSKEQASAASAHHRRARFKHYTKRARVMRERGQFNVKAALLMDLKTGRIIYSQNPDARIAPASVTKVKTLFDTYELVAQGRANAATLIPVGRNAARASGSTMGLRKGEKVQLSEMIKGIAVASGNDAAMAVAEYFGQGDYRNFVARMNQKARSLGMTSTTFKNPNGLPAPGHISTARDLMTMAAAYIRKYPGALSIHSMTTYTHNGSTRHNANSLLGKYEGVDGLKTGFVCSSGFNIVATAKRGDTRLIAVVLGASNPRIREFETARLLEMGFNG